MGKQGRGRGESKSSPRLIDAKARQAEALRLRRAGLSYAAIAEALGYEGGEATVYNVIQAAMKAVVKEPAEEVRAMELARLDAIHAALWPAVEDPDKCAAVGSPPDPAAYRNSAAFRDARLGWEMARLGAFEKLLKVQERRSRLLGLDAPKKLEASGPGGLPIPIAAAAAKVDLGTATDDQKRAFLAMIRSAREGNADASP